MIEPYHEFIFNNGEYIGNFEAMYQGEASGNYDSWRQDDLTLPPKPEALEILSHYSFGRILDIGCGKGAFTNKLKTENNMIIGIAISLEAIRIAQSRYKNIQFLRLEADEVVLFESFDLVLMMDILSYIEKWESLLVAISHKTKYLLATLYLPENPAGFVRSHEGLKNCLSSCFNIVNEVDTGANHPVIYFCKSK